MKLGFVSAILPDLPLEEVLRFAAAERFECVELMCWPTGKADRRYAGVTHVDVEQFSPAAANDVLAMSRRHGVSISALGYYPNPLAADRAEAERYVRHLEAVMAAAAALGVGVVNTFVGRDPALSVDANWRRFLETWRPLVRRAGELGVKVGVENCPMLYTGDEWPGGKNLAFSPAVWRRMFADLPDAHFGLNYDPSHLVWQRIDHVRPLREFVGRLHHVHLKDVRVDRHRLDDVGILATPLEYHSPKLPGLGDIDWGRFFSVLGDVGYDGPVCIEVEDRAYERSLETRTQALRQSRDYLRQFTR